MKNVEVVNVPGSIALNASILLTSRSKTGQPADWRDIVYVRPGVIVDKKRVQHYARVCGYASEQGVPLLLPHIEAWPLAMMLFASDHFPFRAIGMIHLANRATLYQRINPGDELRMEVQTGDLFTHDRGQVMTLHARAMRADVLVWDSTWTFLRPNTTSAGGPAHTFSLPENLPMSRQKDIVATAGTGRRYAWLSGDVNPIHMSYISARMMGFRRAIAHGMWTKACALASLMPLTAVDCCDVNIEFKSPVYLPAKTTLWALHTESGTNFEVRDALGEQTHLRGEMKLHAGNVFGLRIQ